MPLRGLPAIGKAMLLKQTNPKVEDLAAQVYAMHMLAMALICAHPNKDALRASFGSISDHFYSDLLTKMTPESFVEEVGQSIETFKATMA